MINSTYKKIKNKVFKHNNLLQDKQELNKNGGKTQQIQKKRQN